MSGGGAAGGAAAFIIINDEHYFQPLQAANGDSMTGILVGLIFIGIIVIIGMLMHLRDVRKEKAIRKRSVKSGL